jgi:membrane protein DedA with SNARE-associated domain
MPRIRFVNSSVAGAVLWVGVDCTAAFFLGEELSRFTAWAGIALACLIVLAAVTIGLGWKRYEKLLQRRADQALPGDLQRCR